METLWGPEIKASLLYFNMGMYTYISYSSLNTVAFYIYIYISYIYSDLKDFIWAIRVEIQSTAKKNRIKQDINGQIKRMNVNVAKYQIALS